MKPNPRFQVANDADGSTPRHPFDWILAELLDKRGPFEFTLTVALSELRAALLEKTLVEP